VFELHVLDIGHGQAVPVLLPNGSWCLMDAGANAQLSPVSWMQARSGPFFHLLKATFSHLHNDHIRAWRPVLAASPSLFLRVNFDSEYLQDVQDSSFDPADCEALHFAHAYHAGFGPAVVAPDYGGVLITEMSLPPSTARSISGTANSRVNNASIITRLDCYGNSMLICGDMEQDGWEWVLQHSAFNADWRALVSNIDVLVAPHHGHSSAFSADLMNLARPRVVLVSVVGGDDSVDCRYSSAEFVSGITINGDTYRCMTTRRYGSLGLRISPPDTGSWIGRRTWLHF